MYLSYSNDHIIWKKSSWQLLPAYLALNLRKVVNFQTPQQTILKRKHTPAQRPHSALHFNARDTSVFPSCRCSLDGSTNSKRLASADYACSYYAWLHYACLHYACSHYACLHYACSHYACSLRIMAEFVLCLSSLCLISYYCRLSAIIWHVELWP